MASAGDVVRSAVPSSGINQTSFLFASLGLAWLFFITVRGDLPRWLGLLGLAGSSSSAAPAASSTSQEPFIPGLPALPGTGGSS